MAASRSKQTASKDSTPQEPPASMPAPFVGHNDHSFTLQAIMEMQKSIGVLDAKMDSMGSTLQSTKGKVDELVGWKHKILGGALVLGAVCTIIGFAVTKFSDYITIAAPAKTAITTPQK